MIEGCLIGESMRPGTQLDVPGLTIRRIARLESDSVATTQPSQWTLIDFAAVDVAADELADALAQCLLPEGGWYADFVSAGEHYVVFGNRVFRYRIGDSDARAEAEAYARTVGVPEHQLDWGD